MKKILIVGITILSIVPYAVFGQLKSQDKPVQIKQEIIQPLQNKFFGLGIFNPSNFSMSHSFSMSFFSAGGRGISQNVYLNTLTYQIASPLLLKVQWGIQNFPYNNLAKNNPAFQNGFFLNGAELQYKPSDKFEMKLQFSRMPNYMYNRYYYDNPFRPYRSSLWDRNEKNK